MKSSVNTPAKAASAHTHGFQPAAASAPRIWARPAGTASAARKNVPATNTVMNVDSFVAKLSASSAPISAGWCGRGRSRKRNVTASSPSVMQAM